MTDPHGAPPEVFYTTGGVTDPTSASNADLEMARQAVGFFFEQFVLGLQQWLGDQVPGLGEVWEILTGAEDADSGDAASWVNALLGRESSVASRVTRIENKIALGAEFYDDFNRGDNDGVLGNGWVQGGSGQSLGIHDQAAQLRRDVLPTAGTRYAICPQVASGDNFTVAMVVNPAGVAINPETVLYARMNAGFTAGLALRLESDSTYIARVTARSGGDFTYTNITANGAKRYSNNSTVEFKGSGTTLQCVIDGVVVHEVVDTVHTIGASNRTNGFSAQCWTQLAAFPQYSGGLASYAVRSAVELTAVAAAATAATTAQTTAETAQTTANNVSTALDELVSTVNGQVDGGSTVTFWFVGADGAALDGNWTSLVSGMVIRGNTAGIDSGAGSTVRPGVICNTAFTGDGQEVSVILGSSGQSDQSTWVLFGMNAAGTEAVAVELRANGCALRRITRSGSTWTVVQTWATSPTGFANGNRALIQRKPGESTYRLMRDGVPVITYPDTGNTHPRTSGYWRAGFREERTLDVFNVLSYDSFRLNSFRMYDFGSASAVVGTQWRIVRFSTANSGNANWATAGALFASGTFDGTDILGPGVAVQDQGLARVQVPKTGAYLLDAGVETPTGLANRTLGVLSGSSTGAMSLRARAFMPQFDSGGGSPMLGVQGSWVVNLQAGDYVAPCGLTTSGTFASNVRGDATGTKTYFAGKYLGAI